MIFPLRLLESPRVRSFLAGHRARLAAVLLGVLLTSTSLGGALQTEDWVMRSLVESGEYHFPERVNLYGRHATPGERSILDRNWDYRIRGWFPWTTSDNFSVSFWRPLSSLTHHLDYRAWPSSGPLLHAHSLLWYAALVAATAALYARLVESPWVAGLATLLYAIDDAHGHPVGWLTNRNGIMATLFGVLALGAHDRWRRGGSKVAAWLSPFWLGCGLLSAEFALCAVGYLVAYALFVEEAPARRRLLGVLPWSGVVLGWGLTYRHLGHASRGSGVYIDPGAAPLRFLSELAQRAAVLQASALGGPPADLWVQLDCVWQPYLAGVGLVLVGAIGLLLSPLLRRERRMRFWAAGMLLSLPPACAAFPEDRLLFFAGLGGMALVAGLLGHWGERVAGTPYRGWLRGAALGLSGGWVAVHAVAAPLALPYRSLHMQRYDDHMRAVGDEIYGQVRDPEHTTVVLVNGEDAYFVSMIPVARVARGERVTPRMTCLSGTLDKVLLERVDAHTLLVRPRGGFFSRPFNWIHRSRTQRMWVGQQIDLLWAQATIDQVNAQGVPNQATFRFAPDLDDRRLVWFAWQDGHYVRWRPPGVGERVVVDGRSRSGAS